MGSLVQALKKDNENLRARLENKVGFQRQVELEDRLKESDNLIAALKKEIRSLQRIQNDQGKALHRVIAENEYPQKINSLIEELRVTREKNLALEERIKREEKSSKIAQERMVQLEEKCRELKVQIRVLTKQSTGNTSATMVMDGLSSANENIIQRDNSASHFGSVNGPVIS